MATLKHTLDNWLLSLRRYQHQVGQAQDVYTEWVLNTLKLP